MTINTAVGKQNKFATLYDYEFDTSTATVSEEVNDFVINERGKPAAKHQVTIPELSMKQICERYFLRKVNYFTLDV